MSAEIHFSVKGDSQETDSRSGRADGAGVNSEQARAQPALSANVDQARLLAQIAQGLLTAHARLDLMEDRLKEVASQAVTRSLTPGLAALDQVQRGAREGITALSGTIRELEGVEVRLRGAAIRCTEEQIARPVAALQGHEAATREQVETLQGILSRLSGAEGRFEAAGREAVEQPVRKVAKAVSELRQEVQQSAISASADSAEARAKIVSDLQSAAVRICTDLEKWQQKEQSLLGALEQKITVHTEWHAQKTRHDLDGAHRAVLQQVQDASREILCALQCLRDEIRQAHEREARTARRSHRLTLGAMAVGFSAVPVAPYLARATPNYPWLPLLYLGLLFLSIIIWLIAPAA